MTLWHISEYLRKKGMIGIRPLENTLDYPIYLGIQDNEAHTLNQERDKKQIRAKAEFKLNQIFKEIEIGNGE